MKEALGPDVALTTILVVQDVDRGRDFWRDVIGAEVYREYGGSSCEISQVRRSSP